MANITQRDIDEIVAIQIKITPEYHIINPIGKDALIGELKQLPYLAALAADNVESFLVKDSHTIIGIDTLLLLQQKYNVADASQLIFSHIKLGGALLKNARGVIFDHCNFTACHVTSRHTPAFIKTDNDAMNDFTRARFLSCDLHEVLFKNVNLTQAYFANTKLSATQFLYSELSNCEFESITFTRMPRFVHSNLFHSHAHLHSADHARAGRYYDKAALLGGLLISASALIITLMMFDLIASTTALAALAVGLLVSGILLGYLGAASSYRQKMLANEYMAFERTVDMNAKQDRHDEALHGKQP